MEDVARRAGVSRALVSIAFRGKKGVSDDTRRAIFEAAEALGYHHNAIAARLASHSSNTVGLYLLDIYNEVFADIFTGMREPVEASGHRLVLSVGDPSRDAERSTIDSLLNVRVDAAVLAGSLLPDQDLVSLSKAVRLVSVTRLVPGVDSVATDDRLGGRTAVEHLLSLGHQSIAYLVPGTSSALYFDRELGYRDGMERAGLTPRVESCDLTLEGAARAAARVLAAGDAPTAIFAHNDVLALGVLEAAARLGIEVPSQLSVIGYDDTRVAGLRGVGLTTVNQQARRLGELAAEIAIGATPSPNGTAQHRLLVPSLVVRTSTGLAPTES